MTSFDLDFESYSPTDIDRGSDRYAEDAEILCLAISEGDDPDSPILAWVHPRWRSVVPCDPGADEMLTRCFTGDGLVWAHNNPFERAVTRHCAKRDLGYNPIAVERWRCSAALCRRAGWPAALGKAAEVLGLPEQKDTDGKSLIRLFCIPQTVGKRKGLRVLPADEPAKFASFVSYCKQDVRTQKHLRHKLKGFTLTGDLLETFIFDMRLNDRGFPVNVPALLNARTIIDACLAETGGRFRELTGFEQTQRAKCQGWFAAKGIVLEDMTADTVSSALLELDDPLGRFSGAPADAVEALRLYSELNYAAAKKVVSMLDGMGSDGRVRNCFVFHGAGPGRWSGTNVQPQNFKKPPQWLHKDGQNSLTHAAYLAICNGATRQDIESVYGPAMEVIASIIRHFINDAKGPMLDADYSSIESRVSAWMANQDDVVKEFVEGVDAYKAMAAVLFNIPYAKVEKWQRQIGKGPILGCGFGMGAEGFIKYIEGPFFNSTMQKMMAHRVGAADLLEKEAEALDDALAAARTEAGRAEVRSPEATARRRDVILAQEVVSAWRGKHAKIVSLWRACDDAAKEAINNPGQTIHAGTRLSFTVRMVGGERYLLLRLPSGRSLSYPRPRIEADEEGRKGIVFEGVNPKTRQWCKQRIWGSLFFQNSVQGTAFDLMANGMRNAEAEGYKVLLTIHDQAVAEDGDVEKFGECLTRLPAWAHGLPLTAVPERVPYYQKD